MAQFTIEPLNLKHENEIVALLLTSFGPEEPFAMGKLCL